MRPWYYQRSPTHHRVKSLTWTKFDTQWLSRPEHWISNSDTRCLLVHLDGCLVRIDPNDL